MQKRLGMRGPALVLLVLAGIVAWRLWPLPQKVPQIHGAMRQEVYIWQRAWTDDLKNAIQQHGNAFERVVVLGAQVSWDLPAKPRVMRVAVDWARLRESAKQVGAAIRVGPYTGSFEGASAELIAGIAGKLCNDAQQAGVHLTEIQIDFDAADSKLDGYRTWVIAAKTATQGVPVHITILPTWLKQHAFAALAAEAGEYVLQVHSLERPQRIDDPAALCSVPAALDAVQRAARLGVPFRVALPTYGYVLVFDNDGKYMGLEAEGPLRTWPSGTHKRWLGAQSDELAQLIKNWEISRPAAMKGIIWYRLPVPADKNNWRWDTLAMVMQGRAPMAQIVANIVHKDSGLYDVTLRNCGQADARGLLEVVVKWPQGNLDASDALGGFQQHHTADCELRLLGLAEAGERMVPGEERTIAWLRLNKDMEVNARAELLVH